MSANSIYYIYLTYLLIHKARFKIVFNFKSQRYFRENRHFPTAWVLLLSEKWQKTVVFLCPNCNERLGNENHLRRARTIRCQRKERCSRPVKKRNAEELPRLLELDQVGAASPPTNLSRDFFSDGHHCETMPLTWRGGGGESWGVNPLSTAQRCAKPGKHQFQNTQPRLLSRERLPECVSSDDVARPSFPRRPILSRIWPYVTPP